MRNKGTQGFAPTWVCKFWLSVLWLRDPRQVNGVASLSLGLFTCKRKTRMVGTYLTLTCCCRCCLA